MEYMRYKIGCISDYSITFGTEMSYLNAIHSITQQKAQLPNHYFKIGHCSQSLYNKAIRNLSQNYEKI